MATEVDRLTTVLEVQFAKYTSDMNKAQVETNRRLGQIEGRYKQFTNQLKSTTSQAAVGIGTIFAGIGAYLGTQQIQAYADSWLRVTRALESSEQIFGVRLRSAEELNKLANEARAENESFAKLYVRTAAAVRELGYAEEDVAKVTSTVAKALKLGSASATEQASTMLQLSQALQKGKLDGDEFRTVMENAGVVQELLADRLKVSKGRIVEMAAEGKLKVQDLVGAMIEGADGIDRIFRKVPATIDESFTVLSNAVEEYIGHLNSAYGGTTAVVDALAALSINIETVADGALVLGAALLAAFSPQIVAGIGAAGVAIATAMGPVGIVAGAFAGALTYAELFGDEIQIVSGEMGTLADYSRAVLQLVGEHLGAAFDGAAALWQVAVEQITAGLAGVGVSLEDIGLAVRAAVNAIIGGFSFAVKAIYATFVTLPPAIGEIFIDLANGVVSTIEGMVNRTVEALNYISGLEIAPKLDLGRLENPLAGSGEAAKQAFADAGAELGRDFVGEFEATLGGIGAAVRQRANELALLRTFKAGTTVNRETEAKAKYPGGLSDEEKAAEKRRRSFEKDIARIEDRIRAEQTEAEVVGMSAFEAERLRTRTELLNEARKAGIELTEADKLRIEALSYAMAEAVTKTDNLRMAMDELKSLSSDILKGFISDLREGKSGTEALGNALNKIADKLIDMAVNDLVEAALGGLTGKGGNAQGAGIGAALLSLFGFKDGGVMVPGHGPRQLKRFARGGVSNEAAIFGEAGTEAAVPLPDGRRIPVDLRTPDLARGAVGGAGGAGSVSLTVSPIFQVQNGTPEGVDKMKAEVVPLMKSVAQNEFLRMFQRKDSFRRMRGN